jgi:hypothetical protein
LNTTIPPMIGNNIWKVEYKGATNTPSPCI